MTAEFKPKNADEIEMTATFTMTLGEWRKLKEQQHTHYPGWKFANALSEMIIKAEMHWSMQEVLK